MTIRRGIPEKVGRISRVGRGDKGRCRDGGTCEDVRATASVGKAGEWEMVVAPWAAALAVRLPRYTGGSHPIGHKIGRRQSSIAIRHSIGVAGHEADIAAG